MFYNIRSWRFHHESVLVAYLEILKLSMCMYYRGNISSLFFGNSEADASELPKNLEEMSPRYW